MITRIKKELRWFLPCVAFGAYCGLIRPEGVTRWFVVYTIVATYAAVLISRFVYWVYNDR